MLVAAVLSFAPGCGKGDDSSPSGDPRPSAVAQDKAPAAEPVLDHEATYLRAKQTVESAGAQIDEETFAKLSTDLDRVAQEAEDVHLKANASLLMGALLEERGDRRGAISFYRQARALVPEEASTHAMLALALAAEKEFAEAAKIQARVIELVPDDLQAWLLLGEMQIKAGQEKEARDTYARYELRRKGLIDGLTLKKEGAYVVGPEDRAACAGALEPAADNGTAMALLYALSSEPEPAVRAEIARVMGTQRLAGYEKALETAAEKETDGETKEVIMWAMTEISRDPVETAPGPAPVPAPAPAPDDAPDETG